MDEVPNFTDYSKKSIISRIMICKLLKLQSQIRGQNFTIDVTKNVKSWTTASPWERVGVKIWEAYHIFQWKTNLHDGFSFAIYYKIITALPSDTRKSLCFIHRTFVAIKFNRKNIRISGSKLFSGNAGNGLHSRKIFRDCWESRIFLENFPGIPGMGTPLSLPPEWMTSFNRYIH